MMTRPQLLLLKLAEEAAEVSQIALKAAQFGLDDVYEKVAPLSVRDRLHGELNDLLGVVSMLNQEAGLAFEADPAKMAAKAEKVNRYAALSAALGRLEPCGSTPAPAPSPADPDGPQPPVSFICPTPGCPATLSPDRMHNASPSTHCLCCGKSLLREFIPAPF